MPGLVPPVPGLFNADRDWVLIVKFPLKPLRPSDASGFDSLINAEREKQLSQR